MKEFLVGMGLGIVAGLVICKVNKPVADVVEKGVEKTKEIVDDVQTTSAPKKKENN